MASPQGKLSPEYEKWARGMLKQVIANNKDILVQPTFVDSIKGFYHAVNWSEIGLFLAICSAVYAAQYINPYFAARWQELGFTQDYFDERGIFITFTYSMPLLLVAAFQMLYAFTSSVKLLVKVKRAELRRNAKARDGAGTSDNGEGKVTAEATDGAPAAPPSSKKSGDSKKKR